MALGDVEPKSGCVETLLRLKLKRPRAWMDGGGKSIHTLSFQFARNPGASDRERTKFDRNGWAHGLDAGV